MTSALIGHTGFVGGALKRATSFERYYNSKNFAELAGGEFDVVVCAGVASVKWIANKEPEADRAGIQALTDVLKKAKVREFILISTIDVYPDPSCGGDETTEIAPGQPEAYGRNRHALELWAQARFDHCRIIRLPALYGHGLKKNALYDLMHDHILDAINPAAEFQWYDVERLWPDIAICRDHDLDLVNLFPEPLVLRRVIDRCFPGARTGPWREPAPRYDMRSVHAELFGGHDGYLMSADDCLEAIAGFVEAERPRG